MDEVVYCFLVLKIHKLGSGGSYDELRHLKDDNCYIIL